MWQRPRELPSTIGAPTLLTLLVTLLVTAAGFSRPAMAQIPETFSNLQVLDAEISPRELVGVMRSFAGSLGVRCNHCHVGPDDLQGMDFATDEKDAKKSARQMMQMVRHINGEVLAKLPVAAGRESEQVSCYTCHRGLATPPRSSREVLLATVESEGVDAALVQLEDFAERYAAAGVYNLSPRNLAAVGRTLAEQGKTDEASNWLHKVAERYPQNADLPATLGMVYQQAGNVDAASRAFEEALRIDPAHPWAQQAKARLKP